MKSQCVVKSIFGDASDNDWLSVPVATVVTLSPPTGAGPTTTADLIRAILDGVAESADRQVREWAERMKRGS